MCTPYHYFFHNRITDAFNNVRDRVRYLEAISPHVEPLEMPSPPAPSQVISTTLPSLMTTMKQMEGVSRMYACSGYLGVLCIKVYSHTFTTSGVDTEVMKTWNAPFPQIVIHFNDYQGLEISETLS